MHLTPLAAVIFYLTSFSIAVRAIPTDPRGQSLNPRLQTFPIAPRDLPIGTCNDQTPCSNKACCSKKG
jgi:hypothetical protein